MNEKELNKLVKEHYGFTIEELDNDVAYWCFRCSELQQENKELKEYIKELEENSGVLVSQVESWSKTADIYLEKSIRLQKENDELHNKIDKAIDFINNNGEKQYNHHYNYRGKWYSPDELDTILKILKDSDVDER